MRIVLLIVAIVSMQTAVYAQPSAEDLYTEGQAAYDRADHATAVDKWQAAYDLSKESTLLFNIAQAKRLSGDCTGATATYRRFIETDADKASEQHKLAKEFTHELEGTCPEQKLAILPSKIGDPPKLGRELNLSPVLSDPKSDSSQPGRTWKIAGLMTGGVGVVAIAVGLGLGHHGTSIGDEITAECARPESCDWAALKDKDARGRREVAIGKALDVVGVAAIAGGAIFYYLGVRQDALAITPTAHDGGAVISWSGSW